MPWDGYKGLMSREVELKVVINLRVYSEKEKKSDALQEQ